MAIQPGYPDYARLTSQGGSQLFFQGLLKNNTYTTVVIDTLGYAYVIFEIQDFANPGFVTNKVRWWDTITKNLIVDSQYFTPVPSCDQSIKLPCLTRFMDFTGAPVGAGQSGTSNYYVYGTNAGDPNPKTHQQAAPLLYGNQTIATGTSFFVTATEFYTGPAVFSVFSNGSHTYDAHLEYFDQASASWLPFAWQWGADNGQGFIKDVMIPPAPLRMNVSNTSGANLTLWASVIAA